MFYLDLYVIIYDMDISFKLTGSGERLSRLVCREKPGRAPTVIRPVLTVQDVCRQLHRSRRHVYRYLKAGRLRPCARILGQWLFSTEEIRSFQSGRVPGFLNSLFWDARPADLSVRHHRDFILARLLESGNREAVAWVFRTYPKAQVRVFLRDRGSEVLSPRTKHFWGMLLGMAEGREERAPWRRWGRRWGGIA